MARTKGSTKRSVRQARRQQTNIPRLLALARRLDSKAAFPDAQVEFSYGLLSRMGSTLSLMPNGIPSGMSDGPLWCWVMAAFPSDFEVVGGSRVQVRGQIPVKPSMLVPQWLGIPMSQFQKWTAAKSTAELVVYLEAWMAASKNRRLKPESNKVTDATKEK